MTKTKKSYSKKYTPLNVSNVHRRKKRTSEKKRKGGALNEDKVEVSFVKSPNTGATLSFIDIFKGPASLMGSIPYTIEYLEEMLGFIKTGFKTKETGVKIDKKTFSIKSNDTTDATPNETQ